MAFVDLEKAFDRVPRAVDCGLVGFEEARCGCFQVNSWTNKVVDNQLVDKPHRGRANSWTNQFVDRPTRGQTKSWTNQLVDKSTRGQTNSWTIENLVSK